jgi:hypothetical protein
MAQAPKGNADRASFVRDIVFDPKAHCNGLALRF